MGLEAQSFELIDAGGFFNYLLYDGGIARYPRLYGIYLGVWFAGGSVMFVLIGVVGYLTGFAVFPASGPTLLGDIVFLLQLALPLIPVAILEVRRRRRGGSQPVEKALASGFAKLIPWNEVNRIELKPVRFNTRRWTMTIVTGSTVYKARVSELGAIGEFLSKKLGNKLQVYEQSGIHIMPAT